MAVEPPRGAPGNARTLRWVAVGLAVAAVAFMAATLVVARAAEVDSHLDDLRGNSLPSVTHLLGARVAVQDLEAASRALASSPSAERGTLFQTALRARVACETEIDRYSATPWYPGEQELYDSKMRPSLESMDGAFIELSGTLDAGPADVAGAARRFDGTLRALDGVILEIARLNQAEAEEAVAGMGLARARSLHLAIAFGACSAIFGLFAAVFALRGARLHERVLRDHEELLRARAGELEGFAQRVAHDLVSPLSAVSFVLDRIGRERPDASTGRLVQRAKASLERSRRLVEAIFDFARAAARPNPGARASLADALRDLRDELATSDGDGSHSVVVEPFEDCEVRCERSALFSILYNLASNALKYVRDSDVQRVTVRVRPGLDRVRVEVEDTGPGVPQEMVESIFEPYVRGSGASQPGLGLGLATVKKFVVAYGGTVQVERLSTGSLFWVELPRAPVVQNGGAVPARTEQGGQKTKTAEDVNVS